MLFQLLRIDESIQINAARLFNKFYPLENAILYLIHFTPNYPK